MRSWKRSGPTGLKHFSVFVLRETVRFLRYAWASWLMSVASFAIAMCIIGFFAGMAWNAHTAMTSLRENLAVQAFFDPALSSSDAASIAEEHLKKIEGISRYSLISKEQALEDYRTMSGEDVEQVLGLNPLPASVKIYLSDPTMHSAAALETLLRSIPEIQEVRSDLPVLRAMELRSTSLNRLAVVLGALLLLAALFYSVLAARHNVELRTETTRTLELLGATRTAMFVPIALSNMLAGALGGIVGSLILFVIDTRIAREAIGTLSFHLSRHDFVFLAAALVAIGVLSGAAGVFMASFGRRS